MNSFRYLAPPSNLTPSLRMPALTLAEPVADRPAVVPKRGKRGAASRLATAAIAALPLLSSGMPGVAALTATLFAASPALAQDTDDQAQRDRNRELLSELYLVQLVDKDRATDQEKREAVRRLQTKASEVRTALSNTSLEGRREAMNQLLSHMNSSQWDFDTLPEAYDLIIDLLLDLIERDRDETIQLNIVRATLGRDNRQMTRVYFAREERVRIADVPRVLLEDMHRRQALASEMRGRNQEPPSNNQDAVETRWIPQLVRLYAGAARRGIVSFDRRLLETQIAHLRDPNSRSHVRMWIGLAQALGDVPATGDNLRWASGQLRQLRGLGHQNQDILNRHIDEATQRLRERATAETALPRETPVDRNAAAVVAPVETQAAPGVTPSGPQVETAFPLSNFLWIFVPVLGVLILGYLGLNHLQARRQAARFGKIGSVDLGTLVPPREEFPKPEKLINILMRNNAHLQLPKGTVPNLAALQQNMNRHQQIGPYQLKYVKEPFDAKAQLKVLNPLQGNSFPVTAVGNFLLYSSEGRALDAANNGALVQLKRMGNFWVVEPKSEEEMRSGVRRAFDQTTQRELVLYEIGDFLVHPHSQKTDATGRNQIYRAFDKQTGKEVELLETGQFLIVTEGEATSYGINHRAWDWEAKAETTLLEFPSVSESRGRQGELISRDVRSYYLVSELGRGGMGVVNLAWDPALQTHVAIKRMLAASNDIEMVSRFRREAQVMGEISNPNVVPVTRYGAQPMLHFVMPAIDGTDVNRVFENKTAANEKLSLAELLEIILQTSRGLKAAHAKGVLHRDLKLENLFITRGGQIQVADFGLARKVEDQTKLTETGSVMGTPMYMSREQMLGEELKESTDIYSVGVMLYALAAGRTPWIQDAGVMALMSKKLEDHEDYPSLISLRPDLPLGLADITRKAMAEKTEDRYATTEELIADLEALRADPTVRFGVKTRLSRKQKLRIQLGGAVAGSIGVAALVAAWLSGGAQKTPSVPANLPQTPVVAPQPYLSLAEIEAMPAQNAIDRLTAEIARHAGKKETGRSYYYRARVKFQRARELREELRRLQARGEATARDAERRFEEAAGLIREAETDVTDAVRQMQELGNDPRVLLFRAQIRLGERDFDGAERFLREAEGKLRPGDALLPQVEEMRRLIDAARQIGMAPMPVRPRLDDRFVPPAPAIEFAS